MSDLRGSASIGVESTYARPDRECDLIMKGGITSGVVYPRAATHLAERYRIRNVGGASAGAIAAAFVAAAEHGRQSPHGGFALLDDVPRRIGGSLSELFQPSRTTAGLHQVLMAMVNRDVAVRGKVWAVTRHVVWTSWARMMITFILFCIPGLLAGLALDGRSGGVESGRPLLVAALWLPVPLIAAAVVGTISAVKNGARVVAANGFGIVDGKSTSGPVPLTEWMHEQINLLAGLDPSGPPLTFGDLWGEEATAEFREAIAGVESELLLDPIERRRLRHLRDVDFEVMTTNLTQRRPHRFPFADRVYHYCAECLSGYLPDAVVSSLTTTSPAGSSPARIGTALGEREVDMHCPRHPDSVVRHLPPTPDLPVLLAARLSLSFPGLISAVPLYYIDFARAPDHVRLVTAWFSDGGIASNFPMHLFDAMLPLRPTFGFDLQPQTAEHGADRVLIPARLSVRGHEIAGLAGFVSSILDTMQNWSDTTQLAMRTFSARVPEIRLDADEGGINLAMPPGLIEELARRGGEAAALLDDFDFATHQDRRAQMSLRALDDLGEQMRVARIEGFAAVLDRLTPQQRRQAATSMLDLWGEWADTHPLSTGPSPRLQADLRLAPRL